MTFFRSSSAALSSEKQRVHNQTVSLWRFTPRSDGSRRDVSFQRKASRIPPSVDYTELSGVLVFQKSKRVDGKITPEDFQKAHNIDHQFLDLYETAKSAFKHYVQVLRELKAVPRFA